MCDPGGMKINKQQAESLPEKLSSKFSRYYDLSYIPFPKILYAQNFIRDQIYINLSLRLTMHAFQYSLSFLGLLLLFSLKK